MGQVVQLGQARIAPTILSTGGGVLTTLATIGPAALATGPAAPFVFAGGMALQLFSKLFKFGYDPKKLNDTAITEGVRIYFNKMWQDLTGETLPSACDPGQCGKQRQAIFSESSWPNVPHPGGRPGADVRQFSAGMEQVLAEGRSKLVRPESVSGYEANADYMRSLLNKVEQRHAEEAAAPVSQFSSLLPRTPEGGLDLVKILPWAIGGVVLSQVL